MQWGSERERDPESEIHRERETGIRDPKREEMRSETDREIQRGKEIQRVRCIERERERGRGIRGPKREEKG